MPEELISGKKTVGVKQSRKAVREGRARRVYLACDADPAVTDPLADACEQAHIPIVREFTMSQLGRVCDIAVGASAVAVL